MQPVFRTASLWRQGEVLCLFHKDFSSVAGGIYGKKGCGGGAYLY